MRTPVGDINVTAKKVEIVEARETSITTTEQKFSQSGLTLQITSPVLSAVQTVQGMAKAAGDTGDDRMKALAAANVAFAANNAMDAINAGQGTDFGGKSGQIVTTDAAGTQTSRDATAADQAGGVNLAISIGGSSSKSTTTQTTDTARGSKVNAGGKVKITGTGAGAIDLLA